MPPVQSRAEELEAFINRYLQRVGVETMRAYMNDAMYHHHVQAMRRWLVVTDLALEDEGIAVEQRDRVLRSVLYGGMDAPPEIAYVVEMAPSRNWPEQALRLVERLNARDRC